MKRSEPFNVAAVKCLHVYPLSVNGHKYVISGVDSDNSLVFHCLDAKDIVCEYSDLKIGSSHIFVSHFGHVICAARRVFVAEQSHHALYVVNKGDEWRSYWVEDSYVMCLSTIALFPLTTLWMLLQMFRVFSRLCPISYELTDNSYVFYCSDEPFSVLANWEIGTYCFAKDKFPFIVPFHKFNPDNIGESLRHNVVKQQ
jgi:hypothetical protein